jgi:hypothetical protein
MESNRYNSLLEENIHTLSVGPSVLMPPFRLTDYSSDHISSRGKRPFCAFEVSRAPLVRMGVLLYDVDLSQRLVSGTAVVGSTVGEQVVDDHADNGEDEDDEGPDDL